MDNDPADTSSRDWKRIGLVLSCLLVVVLLSVLMPTFATDGLAGSPLDRIFPGEATDAGGAGGGNLGAAGGGGLGALNPGAGTGVGGEIGLDSDTYASTDTEVHFTVESSQGTYWRTAAFGTYSGSGWERSTDTERVEGSIDRRGPDGEQIDYEVTLAKSATAVPTAYRPAVIEGVDNPLVTDAGAIQADSPLEPGRTIQGVSFAPTDDVDRLRSTDESYPAEIEQRYTQLPDSTPDRIETRTASIIEEADATDPYEKAEAIQNYLRSSKEYDLSVAERGDAIADTFLFEMDAGYCEYFATTMAVMLRSQDIPTRYVVGYSTGQEVEDGVYEVRAMNAHAWVEVYFEDVGWVRFDPTPGNERLETQQEALDGVDEDFNFNEPGSPGEDFNPNEDSEDDPTENPSEAGLETELNQTAVPGSTVELTVTYNGDSVPGVEVLFNGESVGITDQEGTVVGKVPDAEELNVEIREGDDTTPVVLEELIFGDGDGEHINFDDQDDSSNDDLDRVVRTAPGAGAPVQTMSGESATVDSGTTTLADAKRYGESTGSETAQDNDTQDSHPIEREASIVLSGETIPGGELLLTARIDEVTIDGASVTVDGEKVSETNESGQSMIELPERTGEVVIGVERGSISGEETVIIPELSMSVETGQFGSAAFESALVEVDIDGEPAVGVPVFIDGEEVAVTGSDGTAEITLPVQFSATISVEAGGQTEQTTLNGLLYVPIAVGLTMLAFVGLMGYLLSRRNIGHQTLLQGILRLPSQVINGIQLALVTVVTRGDTQIMRMLSRLRQFFADIGSVLTGKTPLGPVWSGFKSRAGSFYNWVLDELAAIHPGIRDDSQEETESLTIQEAWSRFLETVSTDSAHTSTPGELATHAIEEDELPEQPVETLRDTFREVEYGSRPASDRLERIQNAVKQIENAEQSSDSGGTE